MTHTAADNRTPKLYVGFSGKYVDLYNKPLPEAMAADRVCRFPRSKETERLALAMAAALDMRKALEDALAEAGEVGAALWGITGGECSIQEAKQSAQLAELHLGRVFAPIRAGIASATSTN